MGSLAVVDDHAEFERHALRWRDDVYRFAMSLTHDPTEADDVVQETYLRAYRSWYTFEPGSDTRRWLFTICRNAFLRTREQSRRWIEYTDNVEAVEEDVHGTWSAEESLLSRIDLGPALADALERLEEPHREVVVLVYVEERAYAAAATILGVPIGTVRSRF